MTPQTVMDVTREGLLVVLLTTVPIVLAGTVVALVTAVIQAITQIQDQSIGQSVRMITVMVCVVVVGAMLAREVLRFGASVMDLISILK